MGLIKTVKNFGKAGCYDLEYYTDIEGVERVLVKRNDKDVEFWLSPEDVYLLEKYKYSINIQGYARRNTYSNGNFFIHRDILGNLADHSNHIVSDNTRMNIRCCSVCINNQHILSGHYHYSNYFRLSIGGGDSKIGLWSISSLKKYGYLLDTNNFKLEVEVLKAVSDNINIVLSNLYSSEEFIYDIFQDFSFNPEVLFGFYRGEYNYETAVKKLMMTPKIKDNIWYWFRFNLFDYYKSIGVEAPVKGVDWFENDLGFIVDKEGFSLNPCSSNSKYYYKYN